LERPARGVYRLTAEGQKVLAQNPDRIDIKFLTQYESFRVFQARGKSETSHTPPEPTSQSVTNDLAYSEESVTPDERLTEAYTEIESALLSDIKEQLLKISPTAFELLIVELMKCLNYGARGLAQHVGGQGDGGLDGLITEDILGLDSIYLQAKRYTDVSIGREKIQAFAGAMDGQSVTKGVFVTTSTFTKSAIDYATHSPKHLKLIDGDELSRLMLEHGLGVRVHKTFEIKRLDLEFFNDLEE
jgi:restriction system protein